MMNRTPLTITEEAAQRVQNALAAKSALRLGIDPRPGKTVPLRIVSRTANHCVAGHAVPFGESVLTVHELDVPEFLAYVETASAPDLERVRQEQAQRVADNEAARRESRTARLQHDTWPAVFRAVLRRDPLPFDLVEVLDDAQPAATPKRGAGR